MEWLKHETGAKITHVPYKGFPEAMTSFKANDVQMIALLVGNPDLARQIREGEVKGLLLPGSTRSNLVPDVPTFAESGLTGDETKFTPWFGFFAPKGTPKEYVESMSAEINAIMAHRRISRAVPDLEGSGSRRARSPRPLRNSWCPTARPPPILSPSPASSSTNKRAWL